MVNTCQPAVKRILKDAEDSVESAVRPIRDEIESFNSQISDLRKRLEDKDADKEAINKQVSDLEAEVGKSREKEEAVIKEYAAGVANVKQIIDLALLQSGLLKGEALSAFIRCPPLCFECRFQKMTPVSKDYSEFNPYRQKRVRNSDAFFCIYGLIVYSAGASFHVQETNSNLPFSRISTHNRVLHIRAAGCPGGEGDCHCRLKTFDRSHVGIEKRKCAATRLMPETALHHLHDFLRLPDDSNSEA